MFVRSLLRLSEKEKGENRSHQRKEARKTRTDAMGVKRMRVCGGIGRDTSGGDVRRKRTWRDGQKREGRRRRDVTEEKKGQATDWNVEGYKQDKVLGRRNVRRQ